MKFKDIQNADGSGVKYGDLTGQTYTGDISLAYQNLTSLEGAPAVVNGSFFVNDNKLTSLKHAPHTVSEIFSCSSNRMLSSLEFAPTSSQTFFFYETEVKNEKDQIIKYRIKANKYYGNVDNFLFKKIKDEFNKYANPRYTSIKSKGFKKLLGID